MRSDEALKLKLVSLLSSERGEFYTISEIASRMNKPKLILAKVLADLVKSGIVTKIDNYYGRSQR